MWSRRRLLLGGFHVFKQILFSGFDAKSQKNVGKIAQESWLEKIFKLIVQN